MLRPLALSAFIALSSGTASVSQTPIQLLEMSGRLFEQGIERLDPILMIAAAKLRRSLALEKKQASSDNGSSTEIIAEDIVSWQDMLDTAISLDPEDEQITTLVADVRAESMKGVKTGQVYSITTLRSGGTDTYPALPYKGGAYAEVYVEGKGRADLNLYVTDSKKRLVCSDTDISTIAYCGWRPDQSDEFVITVKNKGVGKVKYSLITN